MGVYGDTGKLHSRKVFETDSMEERSRVFHTKLELPKLLASHVKSDKALIRLFRQSSRDSLTILTYREETDRIISAIRHIVQTTCLGSRKDFALGEYIMDESENKCVFNEKAIGDLILAPKRQEVGGGASEIMTCSFFEAIEANFPNMVFLNYKKADELIKVLTKYHCPDLSNVSFHKNTATNGSKGKNDFFVKLVDGNDVDLDDWLEKKRDNIEWTFDFSFEDQCKSKVRKMEDELFACDDGILQVTGDTSF